MKFRRLRARVNRVMQWVALALCGIVSIAYAASWSTSHRVSSMFSLGSRTGFLQLELRRGTVHVVEARDVGRLRRPLSYVRFPIGTEPPGRKHRQTELALLVAETARPGQTVRAALPLWPILVAAALASTCASLDRHRRTIGRCLFCNYDLCGLPPGSPCPECAAKPTPPKPGSP